MHLHIPPRPLPTLLLRVRLPFEPFILPAYLCYYQYYQYEDTSWYYVPSGISAGMILRDCFSHTTRIDAAP